MVSLREAKELVMDNPNFKKLEIFSILESKESWIFVINGIDSEGNRLMPTPFLRLVVKESGEIKQLSLSADIELINKHKTIYSRKQTYIESKLYVTKCYEKYNISSSYESENYHKFIIRHSILNIRLTIIIDRLTYRTVDIKSIDSSKEEFTKVE
ncbi:MAG: hypothetical protein J6Y28_01780 [Acholeplasmatales bacterium]|nr:hypothetical protein [Acholeplasmatales bacterium]